MTDELDFPVAPEPSVVLRVATIGAATGALAGGVEGLGLTIGAKIVLGAGAAASLVGATVVLDAALGLVLGVVAGAVAAVPGRRVMHWKRLRAGAALTVLLLALFFLAPLARELWVLQDRRVPAMGMIALATIVASTFWFNAGYWLRRESIGAGPVIGWRVYAPLTGLLLAGVAALTSGPPPGPTRVPTAGSRSVVLLTIDTLRRDHVGAYGSVANTPVLDKLAREGVLFEDAITPTPETAPSHASMLTGRHPAEHRVIANGIPLKNGYLTATEQLAISGYRTGAFVSSFAAGSTTGFGQGFQVYDDEFSPLVRGLGRARVARLGLPLLLRFGNPAAFPWLLERKAPDTIGQALSWVGGGEGPFFLWVHLFEPHAPYEARGAGVPSAAAVDHRAILAQEPGYAYTAAEELALRDLYRQEVEYTDAQVGTLLEGLKSSVGLENVLILVVADHGESLGEHGIKFNHHGLYDEVLRVPLIAWTPPVPGEEPSFPPGTRVARQVNVGDVANTLLEFSGVPLLSGTQSLPLLSLARGADVPARPVQLLGRATASLRAGQLYGVRDPNGVKYIERDDGAELYDLGADPGELVDISVDQPAAVTSGQLNVAQLREQVGGVEASTSEMLKALGYQD
ncbi:MAG: sulfatase [Pseudomonadota bacterium]|nr:sulfatase [Pseudomonadota bacterium]